MSRQLLLIVQAPIIPTILAKLNSVIPTKAGTRFFVMLAMCLLALDVYAAGRVMFVKGDAQLERAGQTQPAIKGARVEAGDVLITGEDGRVQLIMDDGDRMALRPNSRLRIDEFAVPSSATKPGTGRAFYSLIKGGFRALTRSLGARDINSYRVITPVATIGIRGTHYNLQLCTGDCNADDGLYAGVVQGNISIQNGGGQLNLGPNQYGFISSQSSQPQQLMNIPVPLQENTGGGTGDGSNDSLSNRTSPAEGEMDPSPGSVYTPDQPIQGTDPQGSPVDLTPGK